MGYLALGDIGRYQKGADQPRFATLEERIKEASRGDTWKIRVFGQNETLEAGEDLLAPNKIPSQISTNLEEVDKDVVGSKFTRKEVPKL